MVSTLVTAWMDRSAMAPRIKLGNVNGGIKVDHAQTDYQSARSLNSGRREIGCGGIGRRYRQWVEQATAIAEGVRVRVETARVTRGLSRRSASATASGGGAARLAARNEKRSAR